MRRLVIAGLLLVAALVIAACGGGGSSGGDADGASDSGPPDDDLQVSTSDWPDTDFSNHSVPLSEFVGGGPSKDGIPAIDDPKFVSVSEADEFLNDKEQVAVLEVKGEFRAYPIQILTWHEIVNDEIKGEPVSVTFCPLCNSTVAFDREVDGKILDFGTTGNLRKSDLVMYDRQTESWWQQLTADAVVGELTGAELEVLPSQILAWKDFKQQHPDAEVLSRDTGFDRDYGTNPYTGYDRNEDEQPFLLGEEADDRLAAKSRVSAVITGDASRVVYPFSRLSEEAPINDEIKGDKVVVLFDPDAASALDSPLVAEGRAVGSSGVFERRADGQVLDFEAGPEPGTFTDTQTGSTWNASGKATAGELEGTQLEQLPSDDQFWFAIAAFIEDPDIRD